MPDKRTTDKAKRELAQGKRPSTAAGEFVRQEIKHVRQGRHGARSPEQAIAIGLSKARRAGVPLPERGPAPGRRPRRLRGRAATTRRALSLHAKRAARRRTAADRRRSAKQAAATKGPRVRSRAAKRAAVTRRRHR